VREGAATASSARVEKLLEDYSSYQGETDSAKKAELEKSILASVEEIAKKWPRLFAGQRARTVAARVYESKSDWASAEREWIAAADALPSSYMAPLALQNAAAAAEEQDADSRAIDYYKRLIANYDSAAIGIVHAYFALGRLYENSRDYASAVENYKKIVSTWPDDDWTKLATDRIIALKSRGLAQ
jgi:tetratricopeptide (TPR) repeat protein